MELTEVVYRSGLQWEEAPMDEREQQREIRHRLAVLRHADISENVAAVSSVLTLGGPTRSLS